MAEHIEVGDLSARHLGVRVLVKDGSSVIEGTLDSFWPDHTYKREPKLNRLKLLTASGEFELKNIPLDYVVQISEMTEKKA